MKQLPQDDLVTWAAAQDIVASITDLRVERPALVTELARARRRRPQLCDDGRLLIIAADHPGRRVTRVGDNRLAMADRGDYLLRVAAALRAPGTDGVMATADVVADLLLLDHLWRQEGGPSFLDGRLVIGSMNRGGLAGSAFELNDRLTSYTAADLVRQRLDGGKLLWRADLGSPESGLTLYRCARALDQLRRRRLPAFLEVVPATAGEAAELAELVGVAGALGGESAGVWLKLPWVADFATVAAATTLPILLLGGEVGDDPQVLLEQVAAALACAKNVRGAMAGRNVLYPNGAEPGQLATALAAIIHGRTPAAAAWRAAADT